MPLGMPIGEIHSAFRAVVDRGKIKPDRIAKVGRGAQGHNEATEVFRERGAAEVLPIVSFFQPYYPGRRVHNLAILVDHVGQSLRTAQEPMAAIEVTSPRVTVVCKLEPG